MAFDRVQALKLEDATTGGTEVDLFPTSVDRNEDYMDARGYAIQNDLSNDECVRVTRDAQDNMILQDKHAGARTLTQLLNSALGVSLGTATASIEEGEDELEGSVNLGTQPSQVVCSMLRSVDPNYSEFLQDYRVQVKGITATGFDFRIILAPDGDDWSFSTPAAITFDYVWSL